MDAQLQQQLFERYPAIFAERYLSDTKTAMCWGISTGDGWFQLIDALCARLQWETDNNEAPQAGATQVKEKFGTLRFRIHDATERQDGMLALATELSSRICDICGSPGSTVNVGRVRATRCATHADTEAHS